MITKFFDREVKPPIGGWMLSIGSESFHGYNEGEIIEKIEKWRRNNGTFTSLGDIEAEAWRIWCAREPARCGQTDINAPGSMMPGPAGPIVPAEKTPELQGPPIWKFLNTLAAQWIPGLHSYFLSTVDAISVILECPKCRAEWRHVVSENPPASLGSRLSVCQWVNKVHNLVNARVGKQLYPYANMVVQYGAPIS